MQLHLGFENKTVRFGSTVKPQPSSSSSSSWRFIIKPYSLCNFTAISTLSKTLTAMETLQESDAGIFCFISDLPGFRGILKQRYSDFIVNEVDTEGNVVRLTSFELPLEEPRKETKTEISDLVGKSFTSEIESFRTLVGDYDVKRLEDFLNQISSGESGISPIVLSPIWNKSDRTEIHNLFRKNFKFLVTDTIDGPDNNSKCIRVRLNCGGMSHQGKNNRKRKERGDKPFDCRGIEDWPDNVGKFLRFHLFKENKDCQEAFGVIGKMLGIQQRSFGFAGTKDKRAVTTQRVTVFKMRASRLAALNDRLIGMKVGDFCYVKQGLVLGRLSGNRFTITLRGVVADSDDTIRESATALGRLGFINYFGLQRFGSGSVSTCLIGAMLLRGDWKGAVDLILDPREGEKKEIAKAREYYKESNDIDGTMKQLPRYMTAERAVLHGLRKCPGNHLQALNAIPRTLRMMYVHSYQSYLWNHAASMRVQKYGTDRVVVGDLVYCKEFDTENVKGIDKPEGEGEGEGEDEDANDTLDPHDLDEISGLDLPEEKHNHVQVVTEQDILSGKYTVNDIVLPLPGSRVIFPENDIAQVFHDLAKKENISLTESAHGIKEFSITSLTGRYRRVFQKPINYEWELLTYTDGTIPLAETDLDIIAKSKPAKDVAKDSLNGIRETRADNHCGESKSSERETELETENKPKDGERETDLVDNSSSGTNSQEPQTALKLSFTLPPSCYATMAIRELLKTSTSSAFHKTLN